MAQIESKSYLGIIAATAAYYALARLGMSVLAIQPSNITLLWLPSGLSLVMCLAWGYRTIPFVFLASFAANIPGMAVGDRDLWLLHTAIVALSDALGGVIALKFLNQTLPNGLRRSHDLLPFGLSVCLMTRVITSLAIATDLTMGGYIPGTEFVNFSIMLTLSDSLGILLVYPIYQSWRDHPSVTSMEIRCLAIAALAIAILLTIGFTTQAAAVFFVLPVLLILSFHVSLFGIAAISCLSMVAIIAATAQGLGPFVTSDDMNTNFRLMAFAFSSALTILGIALQNRQLAFTEHSSKAWQTAAEQDPLTGLINRRAFWPKLEAEHQRALRTGNAYTVAMLDLDHFKNINDTYGHSVGDLVLRAFAATTTENSRAIDTVARLGGEEFAILLPECGSDEAVVALERLRKTLECHPVTTESGDVPVTVSIGIASFTDAMETPGNILARADKALYEAKESGRNRLVLNPLSATL